MQRRVSLASVLPSLSPLHVRLSSWINWTSRSWPIRRPLTPCLASGATCSYPGTTSLASRWPRPSRGENPWIPPR